MNFTQAMKNWLHKMFAWWPWKQSTQIEYSHYANSTNIGSTQETLSRSMTDGIAPQTGIIPRLSTIEEWPERIVQSDLTETPSMSSTLSGDGEPTKKPTTLADGNPGSAQASPSTQQRLEFLRYLIKHGIVHEDVEEDL
jgi:hypothetical protein